MENPRRDECLVFQIGFDRCGTTSLWNLFQASGYPGAHFLAEGNYVHGVIQQNIREGKHPVEGYESRVFFSDMKYIFRFKGTSIFKESFKDFAILERCYPKAKFILNVRPKEKWIASRIGTSIGGRKEKDQLDLIAPEYGMTGEEYLKHLNIEWDTHLAKVRMYFSFFPEKLIEFDIENDNPQKLIDFFKPEFNLNINNWKKMNASEDMRSIYK